DDDYAQDRGEHYWRLMTGTTAWHYDRAARRDWMPDATPEERNRALEDAYSRQASACIFGTSQTIIERIRELQKLANVAHVITLHSYGDLPRAEVERSM